MIQHTVNKNDSSRSYNAYMMIISAVLYMPSAGFFNAVLLKYTLFYLIATIVVEYKRWKIVNAFLQPRSAS
jgi:hypothetical protein